VKTIDKGSLGPIIAGELHRLDLSVSELARRSGLPIASVHAWISGVNLPPLDKAIALEAAMGRRPGWLSRQLAGD
jgi:transcriptional regulator with XRE-family HTH domain